MSSSVLAASLISSFGGRDRMRSPPCSSIDASQASTAPFLQALNRVRFVENRGQYPGDVCFVARLARGEAFFRKDGISVRLMMEEEADPDVPAGLALAGINSRRRMFEKRSRGARPVAFTIRYPGADTSRAPICTGEREERVNYFLGSDEKKWRRDVRTFDTLLYRNLYDGIDLLFYDGGGRLKYDFIVHPGASHESIMIDYGGSDSLSLSPDGDLSIWFGGDALIEQGPEAYQTGLDGTYRPQAGFRLISRSRAGYRIAYVDPALQLVIDPVYSTLLGGENTDGVCGVHCANDSIIVVMLSTRSTDIITTDSVYQAVHRGKSDICLVSILPASGRLLFSTYFGGTENESSTLLFTKEDNLVMIGITESPDLPLTGSAFQKVFRGDRDCFVAELDGEGRNLLFSTYLGGRGIDIVEDACMDSSGTLHLTGWTDSGDFPWTADAVQRAYAGGIDDAFYTVVSVQEARIRYSTLLGGYDADEARGIALDGNGNAVICGLTSSGNFPVRGNALQPTLPCIESGFIAKFDSSGRRLGYASFFGGSMNSFLESVAATNDGGYVFLGQTYARDIPTTPGVFQPKQGNPDTAYFRFDLMLLRLDAGFEVEWCSYLGGTRSEDAVAIKMMGNDIAVACYTIATDYPVVNPLTSDTLLKENMAFSLIDGAGRRLMFSTLWGGSSYEYVNMLQVQGRKAYIGGFTGSDDFPTSENALKRTKTGQTDGYLLILDMDELVAGAEREHEPLPEALTVSPNYPNPFRDATTISYEIGAPGTVEIVVYDTRGAIVDRRSAVHPTPGRYAYLFERPSLPSGMYLVRLSSGSHVVTRKLVKIE